MGRILFTEWDEFLKYLGKIGPSRMFVYIEDDGTVIMRPSVQSRIDSAAFVRATDEQLAELYRMVPDANVFMVAGFEWQEDRA